MASEASRALTIALNAESMPKKKMASRVVMITTMMAVITVSLRVGQTIFADSVRTSLRNLPGLNATLFQTLLAEWTGRRSGCGCGPIADRAPQHK